MLIYLPAHYVLKRFVVVFHFEPQWALLQLW